MTKTQNYTAQNIYKYTSIMRIGYCQSHEDTYGTRNRFSGYSIVVVFPNFYSLCGGDKKGNSFKYY